MSIDADVTEELVETLVDGCKGYEQSAEKMKDSSSPQFEVDLKRLANERREMSAELRSMAEAYGDDITSSGTTTAALHRGWISLKDALSGSEPDAVLHAAVQGEDHAIAEYEKALQKDLSPSLRELVAKQLSQIRSAREHIEAMANR